MIQTYNPDHFSIQAAAKQDYLEFYQREMEYRTLAGYPPAGGLLAVHCACAEEALLQTACGYLKQFILKAAGTRKVSVLGPAEESVAKIQDIYRMVIYIKHENIQVLTAIKNRIEQYVAMNEGFRTVNIVFDIN